MDLDLSESFSDAKYTGATTTPLTSEEWDSVRRRFRTSMMAETDIGKLAQNIDATWPLKGKDEIPLKYLALTFEELQMMPGIGERPERMRLLADILRETMAFDDPFGEMVEHVDSSSRKDESALKALAQLQIPPDFPIRLCNVSDETHEFCRQEDLKTIKDFLEFAQTMAQSVVVGGDFRAFLNSFTHKDDRAIAKYVPLRPGRLGLHLAEAIGQLVQQCSPEEFDNLRARYAPDFPPVATGLRRLNSSEVEALDEALSTRLQELMTWFSEEAQQLKAVYREGGTAPERFFMPLEHALREKIARGVSAQALGHGSSPAGKATGLLRRLFGR